MSKVKRILELHPPDGEASKECLTSPGHVCGYCNGKGYFTLPKGHQEVETRGCPVCGGTGQVDAKITIEWKASGHQ